MVGLSRGVPKMQIMVYSGAEFTIFTGMGKCQNNGGHFV